MTVPISALTATWANAGTVFTGLQLNVTNTASAAGSLLMDLQVGGNSQFNIDKAGVVVITPLGATNPTLQFGNANQQIVYFGSAGFDTNIGWNLSSTRAYAWNTGGLGSGADTFLFRDAAGVTAQRNSTNAQTLRVYNTFTDASNYERVVIDWTTGSNVVTIGTQAAGTGTLRQVQFQSGGLGYFFAQSGTQTAAIQQLAGKGIVYSDNLAVDYSNGDSIISRGGAAKVIAIGTGNGDASGAIKALSKAGAIANTDIPSGAWAVCRDTSGATTKLIYNNAGTLLTVALV